MRYGKVVSVQQKEAKVIFEDIYVQKTVRIAKGIEVNTGDKAIIIFEEDLVGGVIVGVL